MDRRESRSHSGFRIDDRWPSHAAITPTRVGETGCGTDACTRGRGALGQGRSQVEKACGVSGEC
jgi:hypothetical protein